MPHLKVVIPSVTADEQEREQLRAAVPGATFIVCELSAPKTVLLSRVTAREPNEFWQHQLREFVELYHRRTDLAQIRNFQVRTNDRSIEEAAHDVLEQAGWNR